MKMLFPASFLLMLALTSDGNVELSYNVGVYCPPEDEYCQETLLRAFQNLQSRIPSVKRQNFIYLDRPLPLSVKNVQTVGEWMQERDISAVLGPWNEVLAAVAEEYNIPFVVVGKQTDIVYKHGAYWMNPHPNILWHIINDLALLFKWDTATVIYQDANGLGLLERLLVSQKVSITARRVTPFSNMADIQHMLLDLRQLALRNIIVMVTNDLAADILARALRLSMLSEKYCWILATLDPGSVNLEPYIYTQVNLTVFQITTSIGNPLDTALVEDALYFISLFSSSPVTPLADVEFDGVTGRVKFDTNHRRENITLRLLSLGESGLASIGEWKQQGGSAPEERLMLAYDRPSYVTRPSHPLGVQLADIVTLIEPPFVMLKRDHHLYTGNDRYEGYLCDLIRHIAAHMNFRYRLYEAPDGKYGSRDPNGTWNGMMQELIIGNAVMNLGALSITSEREEAIDFTKPFMQKHFNILIKKPEEKTSAFQFLWPLSTKVWIFVSSTLLIVGLLLYVMDYFSPNFRQEQQRRFGLRESVWFMYAALVGAGTDLAPRALSSRILTAAWWFFSLILISSYTANLAAFLTVTKIETPIQSVADLAAQTKIKYGTVKNTYAHSLFRNSKMEITRKMWSFMSAIYPDSMVDNTTAGIAKVLQGDYAFIWDSPINRYTTMQECDSIAVGGIFDEKGLGIGVPLGAAYRDDITMAILSLSEDGTMQKLHDRWWGGGVCGEFRDTSTSGTKELDIDNVAGIFFVLAGGSAFAMLVCLAEVIAIKFRNSRNKKTPEMKEDAETTVVLHKNFNNHS